MSLVSHETLDVNVARVRTMKLLSTLGPLIGLVFVFALFAALQPAKFLTRSNLEVILLQTAVVGTAALGMTLIIISGGIDLSVGSNIALSTVVVALLLKHEMGSAVGALGGIASGALVGLVIGLLITQLKLSPFIATLGMWGAVRGVAKGFANEQMVSPGVATWLDQLLHLLRADQRWMLLAPGVWLMLVLAVITAAMLRYTRFGRHVFAIGSNEQTARLCGVPVHRTKLLIYITAGALAGIAGVLQFSNLSLGDPTTAMGLELNIIAAVVIGGASLNGGQGSILGTMIGAMIMSVVAKGSTAMEWRNWHQEIITGGIIVLAVTLDQLRQRRGN